MSLLLPKVKGKIPRGPRLFPEVQPTLFRYSEDVWPVVPFSQAFSADGSKVRV
jgi:hypothetical protein